MSEDHPSWIPVPAALRGDGSLSAPAPEKPAGGKAPDPVDPRRGRTPVTEKMARDIYGPDVVPGGSSFTRSDVRAMERQALPPAAPWAADPVYDPRLVPPFSATRDWSRIDFSFPLVGGFNAGRRVRLHGEQYLLAPIPAQGSRAWTADPGPASPRSNFDVERYVFTEWVNEFGGCAMWLHEGLHGGSGAAKDAADLALSPKAWTTATGQAIAGTGCWEPARGDIAVRCPGTMFQIHRTLIYVGAIDPAVRDDAERRGVRIMRFAL